MPLWQARVPAENLFVGKFRDVSQDPVQLLQSVYRFLGVSDDRNYVGASAQRRINPTQDAGIPANLECVGATSCGPAHPNPTTTPIRPWQAPVNPPPRALLAGRSARICCPSTHPGPATTPCSQPDLPSPSCSPPLRITRRRPGLRHHRRLVRQTHRPQHPFD